MIRRLAAATVLVAAISGVAVAMRDGAAILAQTATPASAAARAAQLDALSCREAQFDREVPRGARVYIAPGDDTFTQRVAEFASGWAMPVATEDAAAYVLTPASDATCAGTVAFRVVAR